MSCPPVWQAKMRRFKKFKSGNEGITLTSTEAVWTPWTAREELFSINLRVNVVNRRVASLRLPMSRYGKTARAA